MAALPTAESQLVLRCRQGQAEAFGPLVRRYQNAAYAIAWSYARNRQDAQDLVQEAFIAAYCKLGQLQQPAKFGSWLYSIVTSRCKEWLRQRRRTPGTLYSLETADQELAQRAQAAHTGHTLKDDLWDSVNRLPEQFRTVVLLHYLSGMSYAEIGAFLELPRSTIVGRLQQSRIRLREALLPDELEAIEMSKVDVSDQVQEAVYQIAVEPFAAKVPLGEQKHVALFCGLDVKVEVRQAEGNEVILEGTKAAIGVSPEAARTSVERIEVLWDQAGDFLEAGPHPGEVFAGTDQVDGKPVAASITTTRMWQQYRANTGRETGMWEPTEVYPFMREALEVLPSPVCHDLQGVTRISIVRQEMEDLTLSRAACTPEVQKVFWANSTTPEWLHGPIGFVDLRISVPPGSTLTLFRGRQVWVRDLRATLNLVDSSVEELAQVEGEVRLLNTPCKSAQAIQGKLSQRFHSYAGTDWSGYQMRRSEAWNCKLEQIQGEVDLDVGKVEIEASQLSGRISIRNRHGTTRLYQRQFLEGDHCRLESCSGEIRLFLQEELLNQISLTTTTLCGTVQYEGLRDLDRFKQANNFQMIAFAIPASASWKDLRHAHFQLKTENGDITIEKMK
jgi:RNA polymerase sigma-70 factor (ECF subfamily)